MHKKWQKNIKNDLRQPLKAWVSVLPVHFSEFEVIFQCINRHLFQLEKAQQAHNFYSHFES